MLIDFDQTTMANMTAALDTVCKRIPREKDSRELRKRIADTMVASARSGRRTLVDFQNVGMKTLQEITRPAKFLGLGLDAFLDSDQLRLRVPPPIRWTKWN